MRSVTAPKVSAKERIIQRSWATKSLRMAANMASSVNGTQKTASRKKPQPAMGPAVEESAIEPAGQAAHDTGDDVDPAHPAMQRRRVATQRLEELEGAEEHRYARGGDVEAEPPRIEHRIGQAKMGEARGGEI